MSILTVRKQLVKSRRDDIDYVSIDTPASYMTHIEKGVNV